MLAPRFILRIKKKGITLFLKRDEILLRMFGQFCSVVVDLIHLLADKIRLVDLQG